MTTLAPATAGRMLAAEPQAPASRRAYFWLQSFFLLQIACQIALLFPALGTFRVGFRGAAFAVSLALLLLLPGRGVGHPARPWTLVILAIVALQALHPDGNTALSRAAQLGMHVAILAPLLWVPRLAVTPAVLRRILLILWGFHTLSAAVGVLQVYFPGRFQPHVSNVVATSIGAEGLKITLASGERMWRPMGLTDTPGGAAVPGGSTAFLLGLGFFLERKSRSLRVVALGGMGIGLFCIYLSHIRSALVVLAISVIVFAFLLGWLRELKRLVTVTVLVSVVALGSFAWALAIGGEQTRLRLATLVKESPDKVYYRNRGNLMEYTINEQILEYPLGAGLGRQGMMNHYFGDNSDPERPELSAEIQLAAWLFDGGLPLIIAYSAALFVACLVSWRIARDCAGGPLDLWPALITASNVGSVALTFNYPLFAGQGGLDFWLLNACLVSAARYARLTARRRGDSQPG